MGLYPLTHGIDTTAGEVANPHPSGQPASLLEVRKQPDFYWMSEKREEPAAEGDKEKPADPEKVHVLQPEYYKNNPISNPGGMRTTFYPKTNTTNKNQIQ